jgi:hypothetical protein
MRFRARRREGLHRFIQKRPRTFVSALASYTAVETSKDRLSRDFQSRSIFDFSQQYRHLGDIAALADVRFAPRAAVRGCAKKHS